MDGLEKITKEKIEPIIEQAMQKFLGVTISELEADITDKLESSRLLGLQIFSHLPFKAAKKMFKREFLKRSLAQCRGNISKVAGLIKQDRRTVHRDVAELNIDVEKIKHTAYHPLDLRRDAVGNVLRESIDNYRSIIREEKINQLYKETPRLSSDIARLLPPVQLSWKDAEKEFEKAYFEQILKEEKGNLSATAKRAKVRYETLLRKIKKLKVQS